MDQNKDRNKADVNTPERNEKDLDTQMERETEIRRDSQTRGSMGVPPSGRKESTPDDKTKPADRDSDRQSGEKDQRER